MFLTALPLLATSLALSVLSLVDERYEAAALYWLAFCYTTSALSSAPGPRGPQGPPGPPEPTGPQGTRGS